jgi:ABC-2 type transport system ATP-binding protein
MAEQPLVIEHLTRHFGRTEAVTDVSLTVQGGEIVGFLGANGAGKTTTLRCAAGLLAPRAGRVLVSGADLAREPRTAKARLGYLPDRPFLYERLTAREFLSFMAALYDLPAGAAERRAETLLEQLELSNDADRTIESYSLGMRQKLSLIAALLHSPPLLLLDEPLNGLDPSATHIVKGLLRDHATAGGGVLVSTHLLDVAERICDRVVLLRAGRIVAQGTLAELQSLAGASTLETAFLALVEARPPLPPYGDGGGSSL